MANEELTLGQQIDREVVDQGSGTGTGTGNLVSGAYTFGRHVVLAGLGVVFFGVDQAQSLFTRATERGQVMEEDMQHRLAFASERSTEAISSTLASIVNRLPGVRNAYKPVPHEPVPDEPVPGQPLSDRPLSDHPTQADGADVVTSTLQE